jgi:hypothetical protein
MSIFACSPRPVAQTVQSAKELGRLGCVVLAAAAVFAATPAWAVVNAVTSPSANSSPGGNSLAGELEINIFYPGATNESGDSCSGSLLAGGQFILTAAHCVTAYGTPNQFQYTLNSYLITLYSNLGQFSVYVDPGYTGDFKDGDPDDIALVKLTSPITSVSGYTLDTRPITTVTPIMIAGYGETGNGLTGATSGSNGTLNYGYNFYAADDPAASTLLYSFQDGQSMIAPGDSGGGSFVDVGGTWELAGVHDALGCPSNNENCTLDEYGTIGLDGSVAANLQWIESVDPAAAPEPGTYMLLGIGFAGLALVRAKGRALARAAARA